MTAAAFDPIAELMTHTEAGYCSLIEYDKRDGRPATQRVIIPKKIADSGGSLLVRAFQLRPEKGMRAFVAQQIIRVERAPDRFSEAERGRCPSRS